MEQVKRSPFQGVANIVRFNWHFFVIAILVIILSILGFAFISNYQPYFLILAVLVGLGTFIPLLISWYIYDLSGFYTLSWLKLNIPKNSRIVNIHAGFDETSTLLKHTFPESSLQVFDFYNPLLHTEVSIKRARKAYPAYPNTQSITTSQIPLEDNSVSVCFVIFSAHEIRNHQERILFFKELSRILDISGKVIVVEHLRDFWNFLAYNIGFFHFLSLDTWFDTFKKSDFKIAKQQSISPFVKLFILEKHGHSS
ncbi:MAG: class I SAM-dependent methyltransferase [Raineya sp.]|jgi:ubiquinone/menaquinone biosynthesis C-methylase UbiE|nr:class I SAM-dependent methyltransferase [Raineya sp.]